MKTEMKAVVASLVVLALALTAVSGITYSWFSDTEEADITITTGQIKLNANYSNMTVKSYGDESPKTITTEGVSTTVDGFVKYTTDSTAGSSKMSISFDGAVPGDVITFKLDINLYNTIKVNYKQSLVKAEDCPFVISGFDNTVSETVSKGDDMSTPTKTESFEVTIEYPDSPIDTAGTYTIAFVIQAIQSNVQPTTYIAPGSNEEIDKAISECIKTAESNVNIALPSNGTFTLENGIANSGENSRNVTFIGDGTQTTDVITKAVSAEGGMLNYQRGSSFTFQNVTIKAGEGNFDGIVCDELIFENCTITGKLTLYGKATFIDCTFDNNMEKQ